MLFFLGEGESDDEDPGTEVEILERANAPVYSDCGWYLISGEDSDDEYTYNSQKRNRKERHQLRARNRCEGMPAGEPLCSSTHVAPRVDCAPCPDSVLAAAAGDAERDDASDASIGKLVIADYGTQAMSD
jgi:hypothetical protein